MRDAPKIAAQALVAALEAHYAVCARALTFLALGADSSSAVYRVEAAEGAYLLKLRTGSGFSAPSLHVPHLLHAAGVLHILAPLPTLRRTLWVTVDDFALTLYPFVEGRTGVESGLSEAQWRTLGAVMQRVHAAQLPPDLLQVMPREAFVPSRRELMPALEAAVAAADFASPAQREVAAFWRTQQGVIRTLTQRADARGAHLRQASLPRVLCHADLHTWNVLVDTAQQLWLIDWDETMLAPKERDLMFVVGGIARGLVSARAAECFLQGYGSHEIDQEALVYYRYAWAVQDIAAYGESVLFLPDLSEEARAADAISFMNLFAYEGIVSLALESEG